MKTILKFIVFFIYTIGIFYIYDIRVLVLTIIIQIIIARYSSYFINKCDKSNRKVSTIYFIYSTN